MADAAGTRKLDDSTILFTLAETEELHFDLDFADGFRWNHLREMLWAAKERSPTGTVAITIEPHEDKNGSQG